MNYQEIPFYIWSEEENICKTICDLLGRREHTFCESSTDIHLNELLEKQDFFNCFVFHITELNAKLNGMINNTVKKNPFCPLILFSFNEISGDLYQKLMRRGITDILVFDKNNSQAILRENLLKSLNIKWKLFRRLERERDKIFKATIVTAHHEINQPLTVILNSIGLMKIEFERKKISLGSSAKFFDYIIKSTNRIQQILDQFKKIEDPKLQEYTKGVPMISLSEPINKSISLKKTKFQNQKSILIISNNPDDRISIKQMITNEIYQPVFVNDVYQALKSINNLLNKIHVIILDSEFSLVETEELMFEIKVHMLNIPVFLIGYSEKSDKVSRLIRDGAAGLIKKPFDKKQLEQMINSAENIVSV